MSPLVFIDTETTSLRPDRRAWEVGLIVRDGTGEDKEHQFFIDVQDLDMANADPFALKVGHFYERHPEMANTRRQYSVMHHDLRARSEYSVMEQVERLTRGAHLVGAIVSFDAEVLSARMRAHDILPSWHYHLIDIEALTVGYLAAQGKFNPELPWKSDELTELMGVVPTTRADRHTAVGDAMWAMRMYDKVMLGCDTERQSWEEHVEADHAVLQRVWRVTQRPGFTADDVQAAMAGES